MCFSIIIIIIIIIVIIIISDNFLNLGIDSIQSILLLISYLFVNLILFCLIKSLLHWLFIMI